MLLHKSKLSAYTVYLIFSGVTSLSGSLISTVNMVYQVETARLNPLQLVLVGTLLEFVAFVCQVPTGVLADIYSRRLAVILGTLLFGMAFVLEGSFPRFDVILVSQILFGIGATLSDGAEQAWITDEVGEMRIGHVFLRSTQVGLLAGLLGAIISVGLASIRINIPIVIGGALSMGVAGFLLLFMHENSFHPISKEERRTCSDLGNNFRSGLQDVRLSQPAQHFASSHAHALPRRCDQPFVVVADQNFFHYIPVIVGAEQTLHVVGVKDLECFLQ